MVKKKTNEQLTQENEKLVVELNKYKQMLAETTNRLKLVNALSNREFAL